MIQIKVQEYGVVHINIINEDGRSKFFFKSYSEGYHECGFFHATFEIWSNPRRRKKETVAKNERL